MSVVAISITQDTIEGFLKSKKLDIYNVDKEITFYNENANVKVTSKNYKELRIDSLVFKSIKTPKGYDFFMQELVSGKLNLYVHRYRFIVYNTGPLPDSKQKIIYYLEEKNGNLIPIKEKMLRRKPEKLLSNYPGVLKMLTHSKSDFQKFPEIIKAYNTEDL